jgi:hypothetical protein
MSAPVQYRDMTEAQSLEWGRSESRARQADLQVRSAEGLKQAQENAEARRKLIGATRGQAADLVIRANRDARSAA